MWNMTSFQMSALASLNEAHTKCSICYNSGVQIRLNSTDDRVYVGLRDRVVYNLFVYDCHLRKFQGKKQTRSSCMILMASL